MIDHTTELYCIIDDLLKATGHSDDIRAELTDAGVIKAAMVAALYFGGNLEYRRNFLQTFTIIVESPSGIME